MKKKHEKILLHSCCAPCSPHVIRILEKDFIPTVYFYNPNIHPYEEYNRRRLDLEGYVRSLGYDCIDGAYDDARWFDMVTGLEHEQEGSSRCEICFAMRLNRVALYAAENGFKWFATTLTVSPHKNSRIINHICQGLADDYGINFYKADFKKRDGFKISVQMAKELSFYRQSFCGCLYSSREVVARKRIHAEMLHQSYQVLSPTN